MIKSLECASPNSCWNKAKEDELIFVLLGRDIASSAAIMTWCQERIRLGKNKPGDSQITEAINCAHQMVEGYKKAISG